MRVVASYMRSTCALHALSDRVVMLAQPPSRVVAEIDIDLPWPSDNRGVYGSRDKETRRARAFGLADAEPSLFAEICQAASYRPTHTLKGGTPDRRSGTSIG